MVGDLYDNFFLGLCKLDVDKRFVFHGSSKDIKGGYGYLRLAYIYRYIFEQYMISALDPNSKSYKGNLSPVNRAKGGNEDLKQIYEKIKKYRKCFKHRLFPLCLYFKIDHYFRCNNFIISPDEFKPKSCVFFVDSVIAQREHALYKTIKYFQKLFILGDLTIMVDYFRVLKFLKYQESLIIALKIQQVFSDSFYSMPLALCYERGMGCPTDLPKAFQIYKKLITRSFNENLKDKASAVLYRVAAILKRSRMGQQCDFFLLYS